MTNEQFMEGIQRNVDRVREYKLGMDGRGGQCDCIGLIIGAIRLMGGEWTGTHGSNWAARNAVQPLKKITSLSMLSPGKLVFKAHLPGTAGYALPAAYRDHPDQKDYYHVGVVTGTDPLQITHCTTVPGGIRRDTALGAWQYAGVYREIREEADAWTCYRVTGGRLNVRKGPGASCQVIGHLPDGKMTRARPVPGQADWLLVETDGETGYVMARYMVPADAKTPAMEQLESLLQDALVLLGQMKKDKGETH